MVKLILEGAPQAVDGRFALDSTVLLFADEDGEDAPIDVTRIAIYDRALTAADAVELGTPYVDDPDNGTPAVIQVAAGPGLVGTGQMVNYSFTVLDPDDELVQLRVDWGDGEVSDWSELAPSGGTVSMDHTYRQPGEYHLRAVARDARGKRERHVRQVCEDVRGANLDLDAGPVRRRSVPCDLVPDTVHDPLRPAGLRALPKVSDRPAWSARRYRTADLRGRRP